MSVFKIPYNKTNYFSNIFLDYINKNSKFNNLHTNFPDISHFENQILLKKKQKVDRELLYNRIKFQYQDIEMSNTVQDNINLIKSVNCFTVSTGHQLCLFSGPLYLIYKIISTINLAELLKKKYKQYNFIPVFILASEDHDFQEISRVNILNKKFEWQRTHKNSIVGSLNCDKLEQIVQDVQDVIGDNKDSQSMIDLLRTCFNESNSYVQGFRLFINNIFGEHGLVILDLNDKYLKNKCQNIIEKDIFQSSNFNAIKSSNQILQDYGYKPQAFVREINFFYIDSLNQRHRIIKEGKLYKYGDQSSDQESLLKEISINPHRFSPNVLLTPLLKEHLLPNIGVICGPSEISYWLQLKKTFDINNIIFPILVPRNSVLWINHIISHKINKLQIKEDELFLQEDILITKWLKAQINVDNLILNNKDKISSQYEIIYNVVKDIDNSLISIVEREKLKTEKSLLYIEKQLVKYFKKRNEISVNQIKNIKNKLFPDNILQERYENFISLYLNDKNFIRNMIKYLDPLDFNFLIVRHEK